MRNILITFSLLLSYVFCNAQDTNDFDSFRQSLLARFENNRQNIYTRYNSYRDSINAEYSKFLRQTWGDYSRTDPIPRPKEDNIVPPKPYSKPQEGNPISVTPDNLPVIKPDPKPNPIEPIKDSPLPQNDIFYFSFYGLDESVRLPKITDRRIDVANNSSIANAWDDLCVDEIENTLFDVLKIRDEYNLCDWAYLQLLNSLSSQYCKDSNRSTLLTAFLFFQSGYQMRLAHDDSQLYLLYGSQHHIYEKPYYVVDGLIFYPFTETMSSLSICPARFDGETPLSLLMDAEQKLGSELSERRLIKSKKYNDVTAYSSVPVELIKFFDSYPTSAIGDNLLSRWAMYANTPLSDKTKNLLYPSLKKSIEGCTKLEAANKILNWVQTGFVYEFDDIVWGHDRAFFAEETLYYPYADCEDRSILFSRLIRDLLNLDVALVYYPGHLATAVKFDSEVKGDAMIINGNRFIVCDPTFIGAPVGSQMPGLDYSQTQAILLKK